MNSIVRAGISKSCWLSSRLSAAVVALSPPLAVPRRPASAAGLLTAYKAATPGYRLHYTTSTDIANMAAKKLAAKVKSVTLSSGYDMPMVGLGCYFGAEVSSEQGNCFSTCGILSHHSLTLCGSFRKSLKQPFLK